MPFFIILFFLLMGAVGYLATLNPGKVVFHLGQQSSFEISVIALILFSVALGGILVVFSRGIYEIGNILKLWKEARQKKQTEQIEVYSTDAVNAFLAKRYPDASALFKKILSIDPNHTNTLLRLGRICRIEENFNEAIQLHRKARSRDDQSVEILLALAQDLEEAHRFEEAMQYLREILQLDETNLTAMGRLRDLIIRFRHWDEAHPLQERILKLHLSKSARAEEEVILLGIKYELGRQLLEQGNASSARRYFKAAIKLDRDFLPAHIGLGDVHFSEGNTKVAAALLEKSYELTGNLILLLRLEDFFIETGEPERIIKVYQAAIRKDPQNVVLRFYFGKLYYRLEMIDDAFDILSEIESHVESFPDLYKVLGNIYVRQGELVFAVEAFKKGLRLRKRILIPYYCAACDFHTHEWSGQCGRCGRWNSYEATPILIEKTSKALLESPYAVPVPQEIVS